MSERPLAERPIEELQAGNAFRASLVPRCDRGSANGPLWHGWAIMDAFLAGIDYSRDGLDAKSALLAEAIEGLETIERITGEEIGARFRTSSHKTEEQMAGKSVIYSMLVIPRNIASALLAKLKAAQSGEGE